MGIRELLFGTDQLVELDVSQPEGAFRLCDCGVAVIEVWQRDCRHCGRAQTGTPLPPHELKKPRAVTRAHYDPTRGDDTRSERPDPTPAPALAPAPAPASHRPLSRSAVTVAVDPEPAPAPVAPAGTVRVQLELLGDARDAAPLQVLIGGRVVLNLESGVVVSSREPTPREGWSLRVDGVHPVRP